MKIFIVILVSVFLLGQATLVKSQPPSGGGVIKKAVYVDGKSRTAIIWTDKDGLHIQYFTDNTMQFLGEEVFKDGVKVFDNYKENDGGRD